jgi:hypothetical protein
MSLEPLEKALSPSFRFPGLDGVEALPVRFGEGEIVINKTVLIPVWDPTDNHSGSRGPSASSKAAQPDSEQFRSSPRTFQTIWRMVPHSPR